MKASAAIGSALAVPSIVPASVLGRDGSVPPSERITLAAVGQGNRGQAVLGHFLQEKDVQ